MTAYPETMLMIHNQMTSGTRQYGTLGTKLTETGLYKVGPLFPFGTTYTFYTGSCTTNNPVTRNRDGQRPRPERQRSRPPRLWSCRPCASR